MTEVSAMSAYSSFIPTGQQAMALNTVNLFNMSSLLNQKDSRWLQLEVCREYQRQKCSRSDCECKFAHPPPNVEVQNGRVTACYDSIKGRCNREKPACKYFHPPQHLKDQLLINGRNHLALKNALAQQMQQQLIPGHAQMIQQAVLGGHYAVPSVPPTYLPYLSQLPLIVSNQDQGQTVQMGGGHCHPSVTAVQHQPSVSTGGGQQPVPSGGGPVPQKQRSDRIEPSPANQQLQSAQGNHSAPSVCSQPTGATAISLASMPQQSNVSAVVAAAAQQANIAGAFQQHHQVALPGVLPSPSLGGGLPAVPPILHPLPNPQPPPHHPPPHLPVGYSDQLNQQIALASLAAAAGGKKRPRDPGEELLLALPGGSVMPYKRAASDKSGLPVYQPQPAAAVGPAGPAGPAGTLQTSYHQLVQMQHPASNIVPVTYSGQPPLAIPRYQ